MRIERRYTTEARGAYEGLAFREALPRDVARPGPGPTAAAVTVPKPWSEAAAATLARECLARSGVPARLKRVEEPGIPAFLRRSAASETLMADLAEADRFAGESDARNFFDRFAGQLAYSGWKSGYFDGESDARAFMDEIRFTLATQKAAPEADLLRPAGLFWAYGMAEPPSAAPEEATAGPARLLVAAPPADDATAAIDAEDAIAVAAAGGVQLRFTAATETWRADQATATAGASLNLLAFRSATGVFDAAGFQHAVRLWTIALDIAAASRAGASGSRLALGCANLGALLAAMALPYDSPRARAMAAAILALTTGAAFAASAEMAAELGPLEGSAARTTDLLAIVADQRRAARGAGADEAFPRRALPIERAACPDEVLLGRVDRAWEAAAERGARHGFRNALVSVVAESGLAGDLLDLETAGIAPHAGPTREEVPPSPSPRQELWPSLREALRALRYRENEIADIEGFAAAGAAGPVPHLRPEHAPLLRAADDTAQLRMSAAVQPFVAGDVAHTVRLRTDAGAAEFQAAATLAWRLGLKTVRLCRRAAPMPGSAVASVLVDAEAEPEDTGAPVPKTSSGPSERAKQPLPDRRTGYTRKIAAGGHEAYLHTGEYADGRLGEVFIDMHRDDAAFRALMDEFSSAVSLGLQHGVPLEEFVDAFCRDETAAERRETERNPASILDAVFRDLAASYLGRTELAEPAERVSAERGRGRGAARGWRLPMARGAVELPMPRAPVDLPMPSAPTAASPPAQEPPSEPPAIRALPKLPRTDAFPLDRLTGAKGK